MCCLEARRRGIPVVVDVDRAMSMAGRPAHGRLASGVLPASRCRRPPTSADDGEALKRLAEADAGSFLAATRGPKGTIWLERGRATLVETPAFPVQAVDTLGAGDVFHGAFTLRPLPRVAGVPEALRFAAAAAALKCTRHGGAPAAPQRIEVEAFLHGRR